MKFFLTLSLLLNCFVLTYSSHAQILAWDLDGNTGGEATVSPTTTDPNLGATVLSRGPGIAPSTALNNAFGASGYNLNFNLATAFANQDYIEFQVAPDAGYQMSLSTLDANFVRVFGAPLLHVWMYTLDGVIFTVFDSSFFNLNTTNAIDGAARPQIDLSGIADLQNQGQTVTFRLYGVFSFNSASAFGIGRLPGNDLSIGGTVMPVPACSNGVTTWDGIAWDNGLPDATLEAVIAGNYNTLINGNINACSLTVNSGAELIVDNATFVEIENDVTIDGILDVETQGNFIQNETDGVFTDNGGSSVTKLTALKGDWFYYTYWGSPVQGATIGNVFFDVDGDRRFRFNASNYLDANNDDIDDDNNAWQFALAGETMVPGVGYATTSGRLGFYPSIRTYTFTGPFNTGDIDTPIVHTPANAGESWNFISNPYPSAIDFDAFYAANSALIEGVAYFWSQATPPDVSNPGNQGRNFSQNDYASYNIGTGGIMGASGVMPTNFISSAQGFFVEGLSNGNVTFTNAMRASGIATNTLFFKTQQNTKDNQSGLEFLNGLKLSETDDMDAVNAAIAKNVNLPFTINSEEDIRPTIAENKIWINLTTNNGVFNQVLIGYVNGATNNDDGAAYDAERIVNQDFNSVLYSQIENSDEKYAIQGKAVDAIGTNERIKLGFATRITAPETRYKLSVAQLEGPFLNDNAIYLKDNLLGIIHNLSNQDYEFTSHTGEFNERFEVVFNATVLSSTDETLANNTLKITQTTADNFLFSVGHSHFKSITILNLLGKKVYELKGDGTRALNATMHNLTSNIYIAKVELDNGVVLNKKFVVN